MIRDSYPCQCSQPHFRRHVLQSSASHLPFSQTCEMVHPTASHSLTSADYSLADCEPEMRLRARFHAQSSHLLVRVLKNPSPTPGGHCPASTHNPGTKILPGFQTLQRGATGSTWLMLQHRACRQKTHNRYQLDAHRNRRAHAARAWNTSPYGHHGPRRSPSPRTRRVSAAPAHLAGWQGCSTPWRGQNAHFQGHGNGPAGGAWGAGQASTGNH